ncbi:unnamed protein product [Caenorhabditis nigoni]
MIPYTHYGGSFLTKHEKAFADELLAFADGRFSQDPKSSFNELDTMDEDCTFLNLIFKSSKCASLVIEFGRIRQQELKLKSQPIRSKGQKPTDLEKARTSSWEYRPKMNQQPITLMNLAGVPVKGYVLERVIGFGGFGAVYRASSNTETIAVKCTTKELESRIEAQAFARLARFNAAPKGLFFHQIGPIYFIGQELLGDDLYTVWQNCPWRAMKHPTLVKVAFQAMNCLETLHSVRMIHRDVKLGNFAITRPTTPDNKVVVKVLDFGISHVFKDEYDNLIDDPRNLNFKTMRYSSFETQMGCDPMPKDDLIQLSYMMLQMSGFDWPQKMRSPPDELLEFKRELLRIPAESLPGLAKFLCPWFEALSELNDIVPIDYGLLKRKLQECLPNHDMSADLFLGMEDGYQVLI